MKAASGARSGPTGSRGARAAGTDRSGVPAGRSASADFDALAALLRPHAADLVVVHDAPDHYSLDTHHVMPNGKRLWFGAVRVAKRHVGFHLMPVYVVPALLEGLDPELESRRHGKSCFGFRPRDPLPLEALAELTARGRAAYAARGYVPARAVR